MKMVHWLIAQLHERRADNKQHINVIEDSIAFWFQLWQKQNSRE